ncbi:Oidioi.mRNA.OKI2018_I69.chr2.g5324.t1.cds [Oikopleura dioica]|uniref:Oidioi.mRNA.OKI2018_I69.chr2.g5324.t1.cds n=1 Tax=Oikopleura dioica TaxID=34765 RepID=A0ABN7T6N2_OIKDI|nr:Oidioi.mRNA.OKI2018_I69.chr2.g5324.t1.cds [Oikopleura dioica]
MSEKFHQIPSAEIKRQLQNSEVLFIDVRAAYELESGKIQADRFLNIPHSDIVHQFMQKDEDFKTIHGIEKPKKNQKIIVYCKSGRRGEMAQAFLVELGYSDVSNWAGGYHKL